MIVAISGKIHSGKDEVGKIIQYLFYLKSNIHKDNKLSYKSFVKTNRVNNLLISDIVPEIKKFADTLKDIICLLTGCTREQLENEDFKNSTLPDEWAFYGFGEVKGSLHSEVKIDYLSSQCNSQFENGIDINTKYICKPTYRDLLQYIGTDLFRNQLHENVWINALMSKYIGTHKAIQYGTTDGLDRIPTGDITEYPNWIITDCRFENEAKAIKDRGGIIIRVNRINRELEMIKSMASTTGVGSKLMDKIHNSNHPSETSLDNYEFDYVIDNNDTIEELILRVKEILQIERII